jgi:hypothetical protein
MFLPDLTGIFITKDLKTVEDLPNADNNSYLWTYDLYALNVMLLIRSTPLRGQVRGGWLGPGN